MRHTHPPEPSHTDHEWRLSEDIIFEDGAVFLRDDCEWVEILGSHTDEARDETYYNEGASCDESRTRRLDMSEIRHDSHSDGFLITTTYEIDDIEVAGEDRYIEGLIELIECLEAYDDVEIEQVGATAKHVEEVRVYVGETEVVYK